MHNLWLNHVDYHVVWWLQLLIILFCAALHQGTLFITQCCERMKFPAIPRKKRLWCWRPDLKRQQISRDFIGIRKLHFVEICPLCICSAWCSSHCYVCHVSDSTYVPLQICLWSHAVTEFSVFKLLANIILSYSNLFAFLFFVHCLAQPDQVAAAAWLLDLQINFQRSVDIT